MDINVTGELEGQEDKSQLSQGLIFSSRNIILPIFYFSWNILQIRRVGGCGKLASASHRQATRMPRIYPIWFVFRGSSPTASSSTP